MGSQGREMVSMGGTHAYTVVDLERDDEENEEVDTFHAHGKEASSSEEGRRFTPGVLQFGAPSFWRTMIVNTRLPKTPMGRALLLFLVLLAMALAAGLLLASSSSSSSSPSFSPFPSCVRATKAAVATELRTCSDIGVSIMRDLGGNCVPHPPWPEGCVLAVVVVDGVCCPSTAAGNAVDAAVASCLCIGVLNSFSSGIGGGGVML